MDHDPFLAHLILILSVYVLPTSPSDIPSYNGPSTCQTDNILRALNTMARRMYAAEDNLASITASQSPTISDIPPFSIPSAKSSQATFPSSDSFTTLGYSSTTTRLSFSIPHSSSSFPHNATSLATDFERNANISESCSDRERSYHAVQLTDRALDGFQPDDCPKGLLHEFVPPTPQGDFVLCPLCGSTSDSIAISKEFSAFKTSSPSDFPLVVPPRHPINAASESDMGAVEELRLLKAQISDVARVCNAVAHGDLSQKVTVPVQGVVMIQFRNVVNRMVENLDLFATEVTRVSQEVGAKGNLGGQAPVLDFEGAWLELTHNVNRLCSSLTEQVRSIATVTTAVAKGDLTRKIEIQAEGEMATLKTTVNYMVDQLSSFASKITRVTLEFGTPGILGGQECVETVQGTWADLTLNLNRRASDLTNQIRAISEVIKAVALGDLSKQVQVDAQGEMLDLKMIVNSMVNQLCTLANEIMWVSLQVGSEGILGGQATVPDVQGTWKVLTDNVNLMVMNLTDQVRSIAEVTKAVASGDLTKTIELDVRGEILDLKETVNEMTETLRNFVVEVTRVVREFGTDGHLGCRANVTNVGGTWKDLMDCVNMLAANLTLQVRTFAVAITAVARGDLTQKVTGLTVFGEYLHLVTAINDMIDELGSFASGVKKVTREVGTEGKLDVQVEVGKVQGIWQDITISINALASNLTTHIRGFAQISAAITDRDLTCSTIPVGASTEMDSRRTQINQMVFNVRDSIQKNTAAREAAELANRSKSEFLAEVCQEIRTPMNGITGLAELTLESDLNRSQRENLLLIHSFARSLALIINNLSDILKLDIGRMIMDQVPFSFRQTVFGILKTLVVRAAGNNLDLTYDVDSDIPDQLIGDSLRLQQVITNLVSNAIRFHPSPVSKGHVALSCRQLALDDSSVTLEFCVSDNGIGISKGKLKLISDSLARADCSAIWENGGAGLRLSISKGLVSLMGGSMWVESEVGKGSKFFFTITSQIGHLSMDATLAKMPFGKRNILFVDTLHDPTGVADRIQELTLKPYVIHDPRAVADRATCPHIDTIVVDSLSVTETIHEYKHLQQIPIVLLSPDPPRLNLKWCYDNGVCSEVPTPASAQDLATALLSAFESSTVSLGATNDEIFCVLVAEDNLVNRKLAIKMLEKYGHTVEAVENGSLAVDAFKARVLENRPFDIILMDVFMPIMGGMEATELIRTYETHNDLTPTPIIALGTHGTTGDREHCLNAGMDDYITKPLRRSDLHNSITRLVSERARQ